MRLNGDKLQPSIRQSPCTGVTASEMHPGQFPPLPKTPSHHRSFSRSAVNQCAGVTSARPTGQNSRQRWKLQPALFQSLVLTTLMKHMKYSLRCCLMPPKRTVRGFAEPTTSHAGMISMKICFVLTQKQHQVQKEYQQSQNSLPGSTTSAKRGGRKPLSQLTSPTQADEHGRPSTS